MLLLAAGIASAQNPSGLWKGKIYTDVFSYDIGFDLRVDQNNNVTGFVRAYHTLRDYAEAKVKGRYDKKNHRLIFTEIEIVKANCNLPANILLDRYDLQISKKSSDDLYGYTHCTKKGEEECEKTKAVRVKRFDDNLVKN